MTGIICVNKPKDITSFGVVAKIRGIMREKKAGHTGTLDPMATGVLPIMLGGATRFLNFLEDSDKSYRATFVLGITTDTLDITGKILDKKEVHSTVQDVEKALELFKGKIMQTPPMYSAKSVDGVRLYDLARKGIEIEREACEVEIKSINLVDACEKDNTYVIDVYCSKGTYIRSLIDDIGNRLGCGAVMTELQRTSAMGFSLDDCVTLDELQAIKDSNGSFDDFIIDVENILGCYDRIDVSPAQAKRFSNGGELSVDRIKQNLCNNTIYRVYGDDSFLGLGKVQESDLKVARLLTKRD